MQSSPQQLLKINDLKIALLKTPACLFGSMAYWQSKIKTPGFNEKSG
jgi:hypothetical protein